MQNGYFQKDKEYIFIDDKLILVFTEIEQDSDFINSKINKPNDTILKSFYDTFYFTSKNKYCFKDEDENFYGNAAFVIRYVKGDYVLLDKNVFKIESNIYLDKNLNLNRTGKNYFYKYPNISLIKLLSKYTKEDVYIDNK